MLSSKADSSDAVRDALTRDPATRFTLPNGLTVIHKADHSAALASIQVWVKTGSIHEGEWLGAGLSHFLEHMLFKGTSRRDPLDISREVHAAGGYINAYTTYDRTVYYIDVPSESAETAFDILGDMTFSASLADDGFATERDVILREIAMGEDDADRKLFHGFARTVYHKHPYQHPVIGWKEQFEQVDVEALRTYYRQRYIPNNATLVVVGSLSQGEVLELAEKHFGQAPRAACPPIYIPDEPTQLAARSDRLYGDYQIERGMLGYRVPGLGHPDLPALEILAHALGHGQSSILWQRLREEKRLVHQIDASCWTPGKEAMLWVGYACDPGKREPVEAEVAAVLDEATTMAFPEGAVRKAVNQSIVSEINARKTMSGQAARLGAAEVVLGDLGYPGRHLALLEQVSPEMLNRVAKEYLHPDRQTSISLVPDDQKKEAAALSSKANDVQLFSEERLSNGARLLLQPGAELPKVHMRLVCLGGILHEPQDQRGISGILASLMVRDTEKRNAKEVAEAVESIGGSFSEFIGNNTFGFSIEVLPGDLPLALDLLDQSLNHLRMDQRTFEVEKAGQIASIREENDEILDRGRKLLRRRFFGEHPYAIDYLGVIEDLEKLEIADIEAARKIQLNGDSVVLSVSGYFESDDLAPKLREILGQVHQREKASEVLQAELQATIEVKETMEREQAVVLRGYPDVGVRSKDFIVSDVLNEVFSGMSSVLFNRVREERGLAYYVGSSRVPGLDSGMFYFYAGTQPDKTDEVTKEILGEIDRICRGNFEEGELEACLTRMSVQKRQSLQSPGSRSMQAALNALYDQPLNGWKNYDERLAAVTPERLAEHARSIFKPEHVVAVVVGPE
ncbi:pitrilysin family protein [Rubellicoccus peritrichatus]|uniref:Pitrilysin family protein n=1 Tax=Rubellicoccus peritrichatus TaxID=3080537 RepID=A0AAQ3L826_9BACT|nr:pitrilysin family protein [Puniceicoccus sp. CR14]WOO40646.1 pitrilysin family protein [Puniceicoccus sp. CR14]